MLADTHSKDVWKGCAPLFMSRYIFLMKIGFESVQKAKVALMGDLINERPSTALNRRVIRFARDCDQPSGQ